MATLTPKDLDKTAVALWARKVWTDDRRTKRKKLVVSKVRNSNTKIRTLNTLRFKIPVLIYQRKPLCHSIKHTNTCQYNVRPVFNFKRPVVLGFISIFAAHEHYNFGH